MVRSRGRRRQGEGEIGVQGVVGGEGFGVGRGPEVFALALE